MASRILPLDQVTEDDVLAKDVFGPTGEILLRQGGKLSERSKQILINRGVDVVSVVCEIDPAVLERERSRIDEELATRFRRVAHEPLMQALRASVLKVKLNNLSTDVS